MRVEKIRELGLFTEEQLQKSDECFACSEMPPGEPCPDCLREYEEQTGD